MIQLRENAPNSLSGATAQVLTPKAGNRRRQVLPQPGRRWHLTLAAEDWQFIHNPVATPGATAIWRAGSSGTPPDPQGRYKASTALAPHQGAANRSRHTPAFRLRTKQI